MTAIIDAVRSHLCGYFEESGPSEAKVTFLGADPLTILRFGPDRDNTVTYATLGCSRSPMQDPSALVLSPDDGPRAELVLPVVGGLDAITRPLAMLAASPAVEGLVLQDGALLDFGQPLWPDGRFTGFILVDAAVPDVTAASTDPAPDPAPEPVTVTVSMLQPVPATPNECALARAKGVPELRALWRDRATVLADPHRASVV